MAKYTLESLEVIFKGLAVSLFGLSFAGIAGSASPDLMPIATLGMSGIVALITSRVFGTLALED